MGSAHFYSQLVCLSLMIKIDFIGVGSDLLLDLCTEILKRGGNVNETIEIKY